MDLSPNCCPALWGASVTVETITVFWVIPVSQLSSSGQDIYKTNVLCLTLQSSISRSWIAQRSIMACANVIFDSFLPSRPGVGQAAGYFLPCGCWGGGPVVMAFICRKSNADGSLLHVFPDAWSDALTTFSVLSSCCKFSSWTWLWDYIKARLGCKNSSSFISYVLCYSVESRQYFLFNVCEFMVVRQLKL